MDFGPGSEYFHRLLAQLIPSAIDVWVSAGWEDSPEEVYEKMCRSIQMLGSWFPAEDPGDS